MPKMRCRNVGELDGILVAVLVAVEGGVEVAAVEGSGLTCSPKTSRRLLAVPSGTQVISVMSGFVVGSTRAATSVGFTTLVWVTV